MKYNEFDKEPIGTPQRDIVIFEYRAKTVDTAGGNLHPRILTVDIAVCDFTAVEMCAGYAKADARIIAGSTLVQPMAVIHY